MAKNANIDILKRWRAMDQALSCKAKTKGLHVESFAKAWNIDTRTVRRDLAVFKAIDQFVVQFKVVRRGEGGRWITSEKRLKYRHGVERLFTPIRRKEKRSGNR
jgi:hypothetical protein